METAEMVAGSSLRLSGLQMSLHHSVRKASPQTQRNNNLPLIFIECVEMWRMFVALG